MLMGEIKVAEWFGVKSPSLARCKEGDLPLLNFSNLTCMVFMNDFHLCTLSNQPECRTMTLKQMCHKY